eukprot:TRINITY_DN1327_c0_g1_i1.p1 TRINITY_DN1327_c0_g1~~TRINITY_DN1327_c0_g1_i1.p1  ORF type:complete len:540 (+),score=73.06 TRINITY_DN1327_c0_g1_i1:78-1697(+)
MAALESLSPTLLDQRADAEDECVRDLRSAMRVEAGLDEAAGARLTRSCSSPEFPTPDAELPCPEVGRFREVAQPGGFRRHHLRQTGCAGVELMDGGATSGGSTITGPGESAHVKASLVSLLLPMLREQDLVDDDEGGVLSSLRGSSAAALSHGTTARGGDASSAAVAFVIAKNFFGSAFMMTPKGFQEAGMVGAAVCLVSVYLMELRCMLNLIRCREVSGPGVSYENLGKAVAPWFPSLITLMILLCQFGFVCIWLVTVSENLSMVFPAWSGSFRLWVQLPFLLPLVWVRHLRLLAVTNLIGIIFTGFMVVFFFFFMSDHLSATGAEPVAMVKTDVGFLLWLGSCAYVYEGINVVLPVYESAKDKVMMPKLLIGITAITTVMYCMFGWITYLAFGDEVASLASLNLPKGSFEGRAIPMISSLIGIASIPLQAFVIFQTYEPKVSWSSKYLVRKWQKNAGRSFLLLLSFVVTYLGGDSLQNFLALVGGFCCASLALIFPSALHISICQPRGPGFWLDAAIFCCGCGILVLSTTFALLNWK